MKYTLLLATLFLNLSPVYAQEIHCPGAYDGHLQGIAVHESGDIFWSFTVTLVKTDASGALLHEATVPRHHGDLWVQDDRVYVAVNYPTPGKKRSQRSSFIYAYKTEDLSFLWKKETPELVHGAGGIAMRKGHFFLASGRLPKTCQENYVYEYDAQGVFLKKHLLESGYTFLGIQTIAYVKGAWWFGCYGNPPETLHAGETLYFKKRFECDCSMGIAALPTGGFYLGRGERSKDGKNVGWVIKVEAPRPDLQ